MYEIVPKWFENLDYVLNATFDECWTGLGDAMESEDLLARHV
jgi:hypothetical protein